jgi:hypothetical protein
MMKMRVRRPVTRFVCVPTAGHPPCWQVERRPVGRSESPDPFPADRPITGYPWAVPPPWIQPAAMLFNRFRRLSIRLFTTLLAATALLAPAKATWSIIVVDTATGEVIVSGATCLQNFPLAGPLACIAVGKGGGASQSFILHSAKSTMFAGFHAGKTPSEILADIVATGNNIPTRQFGIVGMVGSPETFTGTSCGAAALGVTGEVGTLRYAIQGNVLAQNDVVYAAEEALLNGEGDLGQRVMLAMEAATAKGGDGRCSCDGPPPCGQPDEFRHASYTSFFINSRLGDIDSTTCAVTNNTCSNGDYYLFIPFVGNQTRPDAVDMLRRKFEFWRGKLGGRPDHYKTEVYQSAQVLKAGSADSADIDISLVDLNGRPLIVGGQTVLVSVVDGPALTVSAVTDNGNGSHHFTVSGATLTGTSKLRIIVQDGIRDVQLHPDLEITSEPATELFTNHHTISAGTGALVGFEIDSPSAPGAAYHLLGSASGTQPGVPFGNLHLPLNRDRFLNFTVNSSGSPALPNSSGILSATGSANAQFIPQAGFLSDYVGGKLDFYVYQLGGQNTVERLTNQVSLSVAP